MAELREAKENDKDLLFKWANDPVVRQNSFRSELIPYEDHIIWFQRMMENPNVLQYILTEDDNPIGQIRLTICGTEAEIGYSIAEGYRKKGYGRKILELTAEKVKEDHPEIQTLKAKVKPENTASNKLFQAAGYETEYTCYRLTIKE